MNKSPSRQCWAAGLSGLAELVRLTGIAKSTLEGWHKVDGQIKFSAAIDAALYRKNKNGEHHER
tara:strand:- start:202 stop:393 length:192 start_codon:yes stop_codon:yes gene_type:complete